MASFIWAPAGDIAYRHAGQGSSSIVTACMDRMALFHRMSTNDDLEIDGAVTWVGTTSLNIDLVVRSVCADRAATPLGGPRRVVARTQIYGG